MIENFLNQKNSTRNLSDEEFEKLLPDLAKELSEVNFQVRYSDEELLKDWDNLVKWNPKNNSINSTSRVGMKLCEHFFPNFYDIEDSKGNSFRKLWKDTELLEKVLRWNRKSHSTPYLSELKRGIYFCGKLCKSTMYRPQMAKMVTCNSKKVIDPCAGWGGRLLGSIASNCEYFACEPNTDTFWGLWDLSKFIGAEHKVHLIYDSALNIEEYSFDKDFDCLITSPPYFDVEVYSKEETQSITNCSQYKDWEESFFVPLIDKFTDYLLSDGKSCWNVAKVGKNDMWETVEDIHKSKGYDKVMTYEVVSSARQVNQSKAKNKKSKDRTVVYQKP